MQIVRYGNQPHNRNLCSPFNGSVRTARARPSPPQQIRQLGDVHRNAPRLVLGHELRGSSPARLFLVVHEGKLESFASLTMKHAGLSSTDHGAGKRRGDIHFRKIVMSQPMAPAPAATLAANAAQRVQRICDRRKADSRLMRCWSCQASHSSANPFLTPRLPPRSYRWARRRSA